MKKIIIVGSVIFAMVLGSMLQAASIKENYSDLERHIMKREVAEVRSFLEEITSSELLQYPRLLSIAVMHSKNMEGGREIVKMLLGKGMNANYVPGRNGGRIHNPMEIALTGEDSPIDFEMVKLLIEFEGRVEFTDDELKKSANLDELPKQLFMQSVAHSYMKGVELALSAYGLGIDGLTAKRGLEESKSKGDEKIVEIIESYLKNNQRLTVDKCEIMEVNDDKKCLDHETLLKYFEEFLLSKKMKNL